MLTHEMLHRLAPALFTTRPGLPMEIPGPPPGRWLSTGGALLPWGEDSLGHARALFREYGPVVALVRGGGTRHIALDPACPGTVLCHGPEINKLVTTEHEVFAKANLSGSLYPGLGATERQRPLLSFGAGLFAVNGDDHKRHRRLLGPAFSRKRLAGYAAEMARIAEAEVASWPRDQRRNIAEDMRRVTASVVTATLFGEGYNARTEEASRQLQIALSYLGKPLTKLFSHDIPGLPYRRYLDAAKALEEQMMAILAARKDEADERVDMLNALIRSRDEESGTKLTDQEILGHVSVFFAAGHETTSNALAWTLLLVAAHPQVARRVKDELDRVLTEGPITFEQVEKLTYLEWVVKESMRLFTPAPWNGRILTRDINIGGYDVPRGAEVLFSIYETHRTAELYPEPQAFKPERWGTIKPTPFEYCPFSTGPRTCIGAMFAMIESVIVLGTILRHVRLELVGMQVDRFAEMVLAPKNGLDVIVREADGQHDRSPQPFSGNVHDMVDFPAHLRA